MKKILTLSLVFVANCLFSQWNYSPAINNATCVQPYNQINVKLASDLKGGAIMVWVDYRNDPTNVIGDLYAQRINASGVIMWQTNGVPICTDVAHQSSPSLVTDSLGGAIIVWEDRRTVVRNLFAQRIDSSGNVKWTTNGVGVTPRNFDQKNPKLLNDGSNGAIILWQDSVGGAYNIYGQRLDPNGAQLWAGGAGICTFPLSQVNPKGQINAATGEIYVTWQDKRNGSDYDVYVQKINLAGAPQWTAQGINISNMAGHQSAPKLSLVSGGGAIVTWQDKRTGVDYDVYAQRINSSGVAQWAANGVVICNSAGNQNGIDLTTQYISNNAIIAWKDARSGTANTNVYAQMVNLSGAVQWAANGIPVANAIYNQSGPNVINDASGGAIISYQDSSAGSWNIRSQRINASGAKVWAAGGVDVGVASGDQQNQDNIPVETGNSIYAFEDMRSGDRDIYVYKLDINGAPVGITQITGNKDAIGVFPNPSSDKVIFKFANSNENRQLKITDVNGNEIMSEEIRNTDKYELTKKLEAGIYFYSIESNNFTSKGKFVIVN